MCQYVIAAVYEVVTVMHSNFIIFCTDMPSVSRDVEMQQLMYSTVKESLQCPFLFWYVVLTFET